MATGAAGDVLEAVSRNLASYGITFEPENLGLTREPAMWKGALAVGASQALVRIILATPMTVGGLAKVRLDDKLLLSPTYPALVVGHQVNEKSASALRDMGLMFADVAGNAFIRFKDVLVDVRGRRVQPRDGLSPRVSSQALNARSSNLFSTGRAQVIAAIISWPGLSTMPVREIGHAAGVSTGQAHGTLELLERAGFMDERKLRSDRADDLLDLWSAAYPQGLGPKLALASYRSIDEIEVARDDVVNAESSDRASRDLWISGEGVPGLGVRHTTTLTVYTNDWSPQQAIRHRWRAARSSADANVHVRRKFWTSPETNGADVRREPIAPWPIVYADLVATGDHRLVETAVDWRRRHHRW